MIELIPILFSKCQILREQNIDFYVRFAFLFNKEKHIKNVRGVKGEFLRNFNTETMPVRGSDLVINEEAERRKELILKKIKAANEKKVLLVEDESDEDNDEEIRLNSIKVTSELQP